MSRSSIASVNSGSSSTSFLSGSKVFSSSHLLTKGVPVFTFANQAGLDMLETTMVALQDMTLENLFDEGGKKALSAELPQIMQQGFLRLQGGVCLSSMGRSVSYERAVGWREFYHPLSHKSELSRIFGMTASPVKTKAQVLLQHGIEVMEHPQTMLLGKIVESNAALGNARERNVEHQGVLGRWMSLQQAINIYFDSKTDVGQSQKTSSTGICQLLEKKEGVFLQKMMGKRVNHACRSVISPDPYLAVNEIGISPAFALKFTYPEVWVFH